MCQAWHYHYVIIYIFIVFTVTYTVYICVLYPYMSTSIGSIVPSWLKSCINAVWHRGIQDIQFSGCGSLDPWRKRTSNSIRWALRFKVSRLLSKYFQPPPLFSPFRPNWCICISSFFVWILLVEQPFFPLLESMFLLDNTLGILAHRNWEWYIMEPKYVAVSFRWEETPLDRSLIVPDRTRWWHRIPRDNCLRQMLQEGQLHGLRWHLVCKQMCDRCCRSLAQVPNRHLVLLTGCGWGWMFQWPTSDPWDDCIFTYIYLKQIN